METTPGRSIEDRNHRANESEFRMDVDLMAEDALPVSVTVEVEGSDITVLVEDHGHAIFGHGASLGQFDIEPNDWARLTARAGV